MAKIYVQEHASTGYQARTRFNAEKSDLTLAFAVDPNTAGERLTKKVATEAKYGIICLIDTSVPEAVRRITNIVENRLQGEPINILNIAGNGIYTLLAHGWSQRRTNAYLVEVFRGLRDNCGIVPAKGFRSGGQTGVDIAGAVMANVLGIDAVITLPKGYLQRGANNKDFTQTREAVIEQITRMSAELPD